MLTRRSAKIPVFPCNRLPAKTFPYANAPFAYANPSWGDVSPLLPMRGTVLFFELWLTPGNGDSGPADSSSGAAFSKSRGTMSRIGLPDESLPIQRLMVLHTPNRFETSIGHAAFVEAMSAISVSSGYILSVIANVEPHFSLEF